MPDRNNCTRLCGDCQLLNIADFFLDVKIEKRASTVEKHKKTLNCSGVVML